MNTISLIHRKYKESTEIKAAWDTGRAYWVEWLSADSEGNPVNHLCPPVYGWYTEALKVGKIPELDNAVYLATLTFGPEFPYAIEYIWAIPEHRDAADTSNYVNSELPEFVGNMFFVNDGKNWELYTTSNVVPDVVWFLVDYKAADGTTNRIEYSMPIVFPTESRDAVFSLTGSTYHFKNNTAEDCIFIGDLVYDSAVGEILEVNYDAECEEGVECLFYVVHDGNRFSLWTRYTVSDKPHVSFDVPLYIKYVDAVTGDVKEIVKHFTIHGISIDMVAEPYVKYVRNLASRTDSTVQVDILGGNFADDMSVRIALSDVWVDVIPSSEILFGKEGSWDKMSFIMDGNHAYKVNGEEVCAVYDLHVGYGDAQGFDARGGTGDAKMSLENNIGLIRYKFDESNEEAKKIASAGTLVTTDKPCFYSSEISMVYDATDSDGNMQLNGGAAGKYGKTIYWKVNPKVDCEKVRFVKVKLKYNRRLDYRHGEMVLDGIYLSDGDIVWLDGQLDGTDGLWVVRAGAEWEGLSDYINYPDEAAEFSDPCTSPKRTPLAVDDNVFVDLGARVGDSVSYRCAQDVPNKYGMQYVCGHTTEPGDLLLLTNQSDGMNGVWEVTCAEWIYRGEVNDDGSTRFDASDAILYQNNIDFCACRDAVPNPIFNIEYYYLNAGCYLAKATRKVKMLCARAGAIVPNAKVVITDYSITAGANDELVVDSHRTPGDGEVEDCVKPNDNFEKTSGVETTVVERGCGVDGTYLVAPDCNEICDCPRYYTLPTNFSNSLVNSGFTIVFWQFGEGGWHMYAYICRKASGSGVEYLVYHLRICGIATERMVDENTEVFVVEEDGSSYRTKDAWFVEHGGVLADGFSMYDPSWIFVVPVLDENGNPAVDEYGEPVTEETHYIDARTLYQVWALHGTDALHGVEGTKILAHRGMVGTFDVPVGMSHVYGFKFFNVPITKERFCKLYNEGQSGCICQDTWSGLVTDQCYDSEGEAVDCDQLASTGPAFITTDDDDIFLAERNCYDESGRKVECEE